MALAIGRATDYGTFSRGSDATYFDVSGILRIAGPNALRLDHDPLTGKALGVRPEGARTNLLSQSENLAISPWLQTYGPSVANADIAPDGTLTATRIVRNNGSSLAGSGVFQNAGKAASPVRYTFSIFAKADQFDKARVFINGGNASTATARVDVDLRNGHILGVTNGGEAFVDATASVFGVGDGWYRIALTGTSDAATSVTCRIYALHSAASVGDGVSGILAWGAQLEEAPFASSYTPTGAASAQRLADSLTFARAAPQEGTAVIEGRTPRGVSPISQCLWQWGATNQNRHFIVRRTSRVMSYVLAISSVSVVTLDMAAVEDDADFRVAVSWRSGQISASLNGAPAVVSTAFSGEFPAASTILVGRSQDFNQAWFGTIARLGLFDKAYSPAQIQEMSA